MANCPNCGSNHIQLTTETNVDWGRAAVGWALFGVVGGAVGAVTGDDRKAIICLDCGTSWKPAQLHKIVTTIEDLINVKIDLEKASHRNFVNNFIKDISPYINLFQEAEKSYNNMQQQISPRIELLQNREKRYEELIKMIDERKKHESIDTANNSKNRQIDIVSVFLGLLFCCIIIFFIFKNFFVVFILSIIGFVVFKLSSTTPNDLKISLEKEKMEINKLQFDEETKMMNAKDNLNAEIQKFMIKHPLD